MFLRQDGFRKFAIVATMVSTLLLLQVHYALAESVSIKGATKIHRMAGYVILINYETRDRWTDSLLFKVYCKFEDGEFTFTSSSLNNIERGWHKTEIAISEVMKKRYGSLREYRVDLYRDGILLDSRKSF